MVARVERVRNQEYLFCDTIDEQYALMSEQVGPTYEMWRQATLEQAEWLAQYEQRAAMREAKASDSQFSRMHAQYAAYRSFRIQEQAFFELAKALDNESEPTVLRTEDQVVRLEGTLSSQYDQWRGLLPGNIRFGATASIMVRHRYLATCPTGVGIYLAQELAQLGAEAVVEMPAGVSFEGGLGLAYRVCLWSRLANRVLLQLGTSQADTADSLYDAASQVDWGAHIPQAVRSQWTFPDAVAGCVMSSSGRSA